MSILVIFFRPTAEIFETKCSSDPTRDHFLKKYRDQTNPKALRPENDPWNYIIVNRNNPQYHNTYNGVSEKWFNSDSTVAQIMARLCVRKKYLAMLLHMCANLILIQNFFMFPSQLCTVKKYFPMAIRATKSTLTVTAVKKSITSSVTAIIKSINKLLQQLQLL